MLLGLLGCASHSSLHSLNINSFNVYTLMLNGSFFPADVVPGTFTFRFVKYFSSILYGCRAPEVSSNVMIRTGPASLATTGVGIASGPIAIESSLVITGGGAGAGLVAGVVETGVACCLPVNNGGSFDASAADDGGLIVGAGFVFSLATPDSLVVEWKVEPKGDAVGIETSLRRPCEPAPVLFDASISLISTGIPDDCCKLDRGSTCVVPCPAPVDCVAISIGRQDIWGKMQVLWGSNLPAPPRWAMIACTEPVSCRKSTGNTQRRSGQWGFLQ
jgi:hypothetical protein